MVGDDEVCGIGDEAAVCGGELGGVNCVKTEAFWLAKLKWWISVGACTLIAWMGLATGLSIELSNKGAGE